MQRYKLLDPQQFDDDFDTGCSFAILADPENADCYVADYWIVDSDNKVHNGLEEQPVPLRKEDIDLDSLEEVEFQRDRRSFGWR